MPQHGNKVWALILKYSIVIVNLFVIYILATTIIFIIDGASAMVVGVESCQAPQQKRLPGYSGGRGLRGIRL